MGDCAMEKGGNKIARVCGRNVLSYTQYINSPE